MPDLTIEAIRENPWNVLTHNLPNRSPPLLLEIAWLAADYCHKSEGLLANAVREQMYVPPEWRPGGPDGHEYPEANAWAAEQKASEIIDRCDDASRALIERFRRAL
jgi:hypothetical protein